MGWEKRGNREYYYRKQRIGKHVISEYVGADESAVLIARLDAVRREKEHYERWQKQELRKEQADSDQLLDELQELVKILTAAVLIAEGLHTHKREWRRKREQQADQQDRREQ